MATVGTEKTSERLRIIQAVMSSPGMGEKCRIGMPLTRQTILVLSRMIENWLEKKEEQRGDDLFSFLPPDTAEELKLLKEELLKKGSLVEFYERLKML